MLLDQSQDAIPGGVIALDREYQVCMRCVMDTTAEEISFDDNGICSYCHYFDARVSPILEYGRSPEAAVRLKGIVQTIEAQRGRKQYDCILGLSGGLDSSYVLHLATELGLKPLCIHVDEGWDSQVAVDNIMRMTEMLQVEMRTVAIDSVEMFDLQLAFYKAAVRNCDIPQDHAFPAVLYRIAASENIRFVLSGSNLATESVLPASWGHSPADSRYLMDVYRRFGSFRSLAAYPTMSFWESSVYYPIVKRIRNVYLLNYVPYSRRSAVETLSRLYGWQDYGAKHFESVHTRFFQSYYLPSKFSIDKRKAHLSSLVLAGEITRDEALRELAMPPCSPEEMDRDKQAVAHKLGLSLEEWERVLDLPPTDDSEFASTDSLVAIRNRLSKVLGSLGLRSPNIDGR